MKYVALVGVLFFVATAVSAQESGDGDCSKITYENRNQIDPPAIKARALYARVIDQNDVAFSSGCVGIFREGDKKLIKMIEVSKSGRFSLKGLPNGSYRLMVKIPGFCPANSRLILRRSLGRKSVVVHMIVGGMHCPSYIGQK